MNEYQALEDIIEIQSSLKEWAPSRISDINHSWSLAEAITFIKLLYEFIRPLGFGVALTGGVLMKSHSKKDLDLIIYPLKKISSDYNKLLESLPTFGLTFVRLPNNNLGFQDDGKNVQIWKYNNKRIDLFFLS
jgi:hypothetical protein